jgi:transcription-repair coupling factor (superfamily II helicase)
MDQDLIEYRINFTQDKIAEISKFGYDRGMSINECNDFAIKTFKYMIAFLMARCMAYGDVESMISAIKGMEKESLNRACDLQDIMKKSGVNYDD